MQPDSAPLIVTGPSAEFYLPLTGCRSVLTLDTAYLQGLFLCVNVANQQDVTRLVQAAQLVLSAQGSTGKITSVHLLSAMQGGVILSRVVPFCMHAGDLDFVTLAAKGGIDSARVQVRARKLLQLCFSALVTNSSAVGSQSHTHQHKTDSSSVSWHKLLELIIKLTGDSSNLPLAFSQTPLMYMHMCILCCHAPHLGMRVPPEPCFTVLLVHTTSRRT